MKRTRFAGLAVMGFILGCATGSPSQQAPEASAQGAQKDKAAVAQASKDPNNELVCEEVEVTGSHIPRRICRTRKQVDQEREQAQKALQRPKSGEDRMHN